MVTLFCRVMHIYPPLGVRQLGREERAGVSDSWGFVVPCSTSRWLRLPDWYHTK